MFFILIVGRKNYFNLAAKWYSFEIKFNEENIRFIYRSYKVYFLKAIDE